MTFIFLALYSINHFSALLCLFFFFFKQKTAYEMCISDWSSDVCSSDLYQRTAHRITSPWKWRHLKSVIVPSVQSPPSMLKLHDFCNRARKLKLVGREGDAFQPHHGLEDRQMEK